jgi:hypothetical protein
LVSEDAIPSRIQSLDGCRAAVSGYVMPIRMQARGVTEFLLVRDQLSCCFGLSPLMNHWIHVTVPRGEFRPRIFQAAMVVGTLHVGEQRKDGSIVSIYRLEGERVEVIPEGSQPGEPASSPAATP